jgi:hypothetical protein
MVLLWEHREVKMYAAADTAVLVLVLLFGNKAMSWVHLSVPDLTLGSRASQKAN